MAPGRQNAVPDKQNYVPDEQTRIPDKQKVVPDKQNTVPIGHPKGDISQLGDAAWRLAGRIQSLGRIQPLTSRI